jgi:hypothetical protein
MGVNQLRFALQIRRRKKILNLSVFGLRSWRPGNGRKKQILSVFRTLRHVTSDSSASREVWESMRPWHSTWERKG